MRRHMITILLATATLLGCGVQPDASPRDIPEGDLLLSTPGASGTSAAGVERIYLIGPGDEQRLLSVARDASSRQELMETLFLGPNDEEFDLGLSTSIPTDVEVLSTRLIGTELRIDTSAGLSDLSSDGLVRALSQIVYTATSIDGVLTVRITVDGAEVAWPKANGESATSLRIYDYPNAAQSAQPAYPALPLDA